jgi:NAD(P)-dependent dehydrogenase (short-subunit alcohol dehydrogenase family)
VKLAQSKVFLIAGATGMFGSAVARALAREGASVVLLGKRVKELEKLYDELEALGGDPQLYPINLETASPADFAQLTETIQSHFSGLDGFVWAAGLHTGLTPLEHIDPEQWLKTTHVNLHAPFLLLQALAPVLRERAGRALMALNDAVLTSKAYWGAYGAMQGGLERLLQIVIAEWEDDTRRLWAVRLPPLKSRLRLQAYPAEDEAHLLTGDAIAPKALELLLAKQAAHSGIIDWQIAA